MAVDKFSETTLAEQLDRLLDDGFIGPKCSGCCPDCGNIYVLASVETYLKFFESFGPPPAQEDCCTNICIKNLQDYGSSDPDNLNRFMDKGIVEYSTFNGKSFICYIVDYFIANPSALGDSSFGEVFDRILDKGIVIYCTEDRQIIGSVETFLTLMESLDENIDYGAECCLSVTASAQTYLTYNTATTPTTTTTTTIP